MGTDSAATSVVIERILRGHAADPPDPPVPYDRSDEHDLPPPRGIRLALLHRGRAGGLAPRAAPVPGAGQRRDLRDPARGGGPARLPDVPLLEQLDPDRGPGTGR